jgi:acyl-CoA reductase-like NAD-dependent aldehyde dehydrogenase
VGHDGRLYSVDPVAPLGGVEASGFGHELGREGLDEFLDVKAISVAPAS